MLAVRRDSDLDLARIAHHADAAGDRNAVLSIAEPARRACVLGRSTSRGREAVRARASLLRAAASGRDRGTAETPVARAHLTDQVDEVIDALRRAIACYRELGDRVNEGETLAKLSSVLWCPGRGEEARLMARQAVDLLEQLPPGRELRWLTPTSRSSYDWAGDSAGAWRAARRALDLAEQLDDRDALYEALRSIGWRELAKDPDHGLATIERAAATRGRARPRRSSSRTPISRAP